MPKRKHVDKDSYSHIKKKIKKLERKLLKGRRRSSSTSDFSESSLPTPQGDIIMESENNERLPVNTDEPVPSTSDSYYDLLPRSNATEAAQDLPPQPSAEDVTTIEKEDDSQKLDENMIDILGSDPSAPTSFGKDIQKDLAIRFEFIATSGLSKELRKELLNSHLPPTNCKLIDAPSLNCEIKAAVTDTIVKRDNAIQAKQKQMASAISCLSEAITIMLFQETKDLNLIKLLVDTGRILCDRQHQDSVTRRNFILGVLKKELKDQVQLAKIDSLLFGQDLAETLRTAKAINKSGAELKAAPPLKNITNNPKPPRPHRNLNWKSAPYRRPTGPRKTKESAPSTRQQHEQSSRASRLNNDRNRQ